MKFLKHALLALTISTVLFGQTVFAATTLIPSNSAIEEATEAGCLALVNGSKHPDDEPQEYFIAQSSTGRETILGCAIKSGYIKFWMLPYCIKYMLEWGINLAGLISVLMILVGAYFYIWGGLGDDKTKGKQVIMYAIGGLVLTTVAWFLVNVILLAITG